MATTLTALRRQISSAGDLKAVVRTMKASAASAIGQYEQSVTALADYARTVEFGLGVCLRAVDPLGLQRQEPTTDATAVVHAIVFGSDQGLVGRFNEAVVEHALAALSQPSANTKTTVKIWAVGERVEARLADAGIALEGSFAVPGSVELITQLVGQILLNIQLPDSAAKIATQHATLMLFFNRPSALGYSPESQRLLPLDAAWQRALVSQPWPAKQLPEVLGSNATTLQAFVREHLFVSLFRASAESLASENASRLAAMQRADRNIGERLQTLQAQFHQLRQAGIDEELFDVISGFDALSAGD
ncbi:F-type H+-transporting ATPase subunit gamma [Pseudomonas cuatrocienegasensis]|uniref:F-type H+-transporting ATPase subunit gamma n=1 Tax=Pseudomonas cuatrocienegasensis TaxID=543360 RepID=A0ABY1BFT2_9PSED|nr:MULTISPECIES: F0F1 ATP synthase subunit gamma [Pseudomonas]OEC35905.1 F0F1 ATP synthase subunit gamma [Pseudomonas sp. 21C1]SEQ75061.1 F-type H+-transporting ATPase subunit gamma [Pseudomonas cuatrocienegasensis]